MSSLIARPLVWLQMIVADDRISPVQVYKNKLRQGMKASLTQSFIYNNVSLILKKEMVVNVIGKASKSAALWITISERLAL